MKFIVLIIMALLLAACSPKTPTSLSGPYILDGGKSSFVFSSDGKVHTKSPLGHDLETTYVIADGKVRFQFKDGLPMEFLINDDGSLSSAFLGHFVKK